MRPNRTIRRAGVALGLGAAIYGASVVALSRITATEILRPRRWRLDERWPGVPFAGPAGVPSDFPAAVCQTPSGLLVVGPPLGWVPAEDAALLQRGDVILALAGILATPIHARGMADMLQATPAGAVVPVTVSRRIDGVARRLDVTVPLPAAVLDPGDLNLPFEHVTLHATQGVEIRGWFIPPPLRPGRRAPALLYVHGRQRNRRHVGLTDLAAPAHARGYALLLVDLFGSGASDGSVDFWSNEEIRLAVQNLEERRDVDPERIGIVGVSYGGMKTLQAAGEPDLNVGALAILSAADTTPHFIRLIVPPAELPQFIRRRLMHGMTLPRWLVESGRPIVQWWFRRATGRCLSEVEPARAATQVRCPVFLAHGTADRTFTPEAARRIFHSIPTPKVFHSVEGHDHFTTAQSGEPLWRNLFAFFDEYLVSPTIETGPGIATAENEIDQRVAAPVVPSPLSAPVGD